MNTSFVAFAQAWPSVHGSWARYVEVVCRHTGTAARIAPRKHNHTHFLDPFISLQFAINRFVLVSN
jgi:hypothetical protein